MKLLVLLAAWGAASAQLFATMGGGKFGTLSPKTGAFSSIEGQEYLAQGQQLSALNEKDGTYYILGWNEVKSVAELVGWALPDGKLQPPVTLPFNESVFVGVGQTLGWYSQDNYMIVGGRVGGQAPKGNHALGFVDPQTGHFDPLLELEGYLIPVLGGNGVYDSGSEMMLQLFGIPLTKGTAAIAYACFDMTKQGEPTLMMDDVLLGRDISAIASDPVSGLVYGVGCGMGEDGCVTILMTLDPRNQTFTNVAALDNWAGSLGSMSAIDAASRIFYWVSQKAANSSPTAPFYLVGTDMDTGATVSSPQVCSNSTNCLWSMEFYNA